MDIKEYISGVNTKMEAFAENLAKDLRMKIEAIEVKKSEPSLEQIAKEKDSPDRPWKLFGTAAVAVSAIKLLVSGSSAVWPYVVGGVGVASVVYGITIGQKKKKNFHIDEPIDCNQVINEQISAIRSLLNEKELGWEKYTDSVKLDVQNAINQSSLSEEEKQACLNFTYYVNRINISMSKFIDDLNAIAQDISFVDKVNVLRLRFAKEVSDYIINAAKMQIEEYKKIISTIK
ncbi:hypothetical protein QVO32_09285 [Bacteroides gallinaceum]|uniref:hypothetical protein n=1 Tax=Bacteroidaceae TaxID=815 RepID=UPI001956CF7A|nr:hypothetical protein [Bacteroides gallinaceum]MBM6718706.1 hypothetical protein [Bacteroides gallinaceum]MDN0079600.1 hypothetical protein [Bacteroides gallinaceum]